MRIDCTCNWQHEQSRGKNARFWSDDRETQKERAKTTQLTSTKQGKETATTTYTSLLTSVLFATGIH